MKKAKAAASAGAGDQAAPPPPVKPAAGPPLVKAATLKAPPAKKEPPAKKAKCGDAKPAAAGKAPPPGKARWQKDKNWDSWKLQHAADLSLLPKECSPPDGPHGEHSWTVHPVVGAFNQPCRIEVLLRSRGFRIIVPKMSKDEKPWTPCPASTMRCSVLVASGWLI